MYFIYERLCDRFKCVDDTVIVSLLANEENWHGSVVDDFGVTVPFCK